MFILVRLGSLWRFRGCLVNSVSRGYTRADLTVAEFLRVAVG